MKKILSTCLGSFLTIFTFASFAFAAEGAHWGYTGKLNPENWDKADPSFGLCKDGKNQTPIDIKPQYDVELPALKLQYGNKGTTILNNGHTIQVPFPEGNSLTADGKKFSLLQVHFHSPSENTLNGQSFPMEAHFVHKDNDGNLLVLAVFYKDGEQNPGIASLWNAMPQQADQTAQLPQAFEPTSILPDNKDYIYFNGSLTTPPCSEGVRWYVLKTAQTVSKEQAKALFETMKGANNRPLQDTNARPVLE